MSYAEYENFLKTNVPMIAFSELEILKIDSTECIVKVPFISQNKNHVQSMYLGSLVIGAEVCAGILTFHGIKVSQLNSTVIFKDFSANFLRRGESDIYFVCKDADIIKSSLEQAKTTHQRINFVLNVMALEDLNDPASQVAHFVLTTSIKEIASK